MSNQLYNELVSLGHTKVTNLNLEYPPDSVVIYLNNNSEIDQKVLIEFLDPSIQLGLENQNPTLTIEDSGETTICLSTSSSLDCTGATSSIVIDGDLDYGSEESPVEWIIYIDDEYIGTTTCWEEGGDYAEDVLNADGKLFGDYHSQGGRASLEIKNESLSTLHTLKLIPTRLPTEEFRRHVDMSGNPTYDYDPMTGTITACLNSEGIISCRGALNGIYFNHLVDDFDLEINGELVPEYQNMSSYIRENLSDILDCNNDGFFELRNVSNDFIKIVMSGDNMKDSVLNDDMISTPITISEDRSVFVFCLAPDSDQET